MMVQQNKWRATRFGPEAELVNSDDYRQYSVQRTVEQLIDMLGPMAERLGCTGELQSASQLPGSTGSQQQLVIFEETESRSEVVRRMLEANRS
jgi:carboxylate-amine ligase